METPTAQRRALAIDVDPPFQPVLDAWLAAHAYRVAFVGLAAALQAAGPVDLIVCELAEPKRSGTQTLRSLARAHPGAPCIATSPGFVAGARGAALARQLGAQAALPKPFSRYDFDAALDAALASPSHPPPPDTHA